MRSLLVRMMGFIGAPIISALAPFLVLPVVSRAVGAGGWGAFSAGQSIGILGMVGVFFGWSVIGPVRVARAAQARERAHILRESWRSRAITACIVIPLAAIVTAMIVVPAFRLDAVAIAVATALGGLSPSWYCIGEGNPRGLILFDAVPKLVASVIALALVLTTGAVLWYPILLAVVTVPVYLLHLRRVTSGHDDMRDDQARMREIFRSLLATAAVDATGNAYGSTPIPIATAGLAPALSSSFASADRAYRIGTLGVVAIGNAFQGWVLDHAASERHARQRVALLAQTAFGLIGGALIALLGPWATAVVFGAQNRAQALTCILYGIAFLFISGSTPFIRNLLIPAGRARLVFLVTVCSAVTGITVMVVGALLHSQIVIAVGVACAEMVTWALLSVPAVRELARTRERAIS